ncbi:MAG: hypothetical protein M3Z96_10565 [Pseudomonadota bacterium]|nr:hypothetical protein [Pseudomonadota bacterium]
MQFSAVICQAASKVEDADFGYDRHGARQGNAHAEVDSCRIHMIRALPAWRNWDSRVDLAQFNDAGIARHDLAAEDEINTGAPSASRVADKVEEGISEASNDRRLPIAVRWREPVLQVDFAAQCRTNTGKWKCHLRQPISQIPPVSDADPQTCMGQEGREAGAGRIPHSCNLSTNASDG